MNRVNCFKDMFESIQDFRKIVLLTLLFKYEVDLLQESGYLKNDNISLRLQNKKVSMEQKDDYLDYTKNQEKSIIEKILIEEKEHLFATMFEDFRQDGSLIIILSLTDPV